MSNETIPPELREILLAQQQQIARLSEMVNGLSEAVLAATNLSGKVHDHAVGQSVAFQVFADLLMSASPEFKRYMVQATEQLLARPDATPNEHLRAAMESLHKAATEPSPATPDGQRPDLRIVRPDPGEDAT
jgi:hypothetical protein